MLKMANKTKQKKLRHSESYALQRTDFYLVLVQIPERIKNLVEVVGVFLDVFNVPVPLPVQLLLRKLLRTPKIRVAVTP